MVLFSGWFEAWKAVFKHFHKNEQLNSKPVLLGFTQTEGKKRKTELIQEFWAMQALRCCYRYFLALQHHRGNGAFCSAGGREAGREGALHTRWWELAALAVEQQPQETGTSLSQLKGHPRPWMSPPINLGTSFPKQDCPPGSIRSALGSWVTALSERERWECSLPLAQSDLW